MCVCFGARSEAVCICSSRGVLKARMARGDYLCIYKGTYIGGEELFRGINLSTDIYMPASKRVMYLLHIAALL